MHNRLLAKTIISSIYLLALYLIKAACLQDQQQQQHQHQHQHQQQQQQQLQQPPLHDSFTQTEHDKSIPPLSNSEVRSELPACTLGNDTFRLGERWNPNLPPFGIQVCVLCECVVKNRKNCYEAKVTCRRITNECPIIESCPDGKKPVTTAGQCCKSCQSATGSDMQSVAQTYMQDEPRQTPIAAALISHKHPYQSDYNGQSEHNDRVKSYHSEIKNLPVCQRREGERSVHTNPVKTSKGNKHDLNGIEPRIAFKSLQGSQNLASLSTITPKSRQESNTDKPVDDTLRHDHQHPNDVQSSSQANQVQQSSAPPTRFGQAYQPPSRQLPQSVSSTNNKKRPPPTVPDSFTNCLQQHNQVSSISTAQDKNVSPQSNSQIRFELPSCILGNDTFRLGERWNPNLPPFGVQVCVLCECIMKGRKNCYEAKVTCRRTANECPNIESCPDGKKPVTTAGQCCKSCQSATGTDGQISPLFPRIKGNQQNSLTLQSSMLQSM